MKKTELLKFIDRAERVEEEAVESLSKHLSAAVEWCGCTREENKKIKETLSILADESVQHRNILKMLRQRIAADKRSEF